MGAEVGERSKLGQVMPTKRVTLADCIGAYRLTEDRAFVRRCFFEAIAALDSDRHDRRGVQSPVRELVEILGRYLPRVGEATTDAFDPLLAMKGVRMCGIELSSRQLRRAPGPGGRFQTVRLAEFRLHMLREHADLVTAPPGEWLLANRFTGAGPDGRAYEIRRWWRCVRSGPGCDQVNCINPSDRVFPRDDGFDLVRGDNRSGSIADRIRFRIEFKDETRQLNRVSSEPAERAASDSDFEYLANFEYLAELWAERWWLLPSRAPRRPGEVVPWPWEATAESVVTYEPRKMWLDGFVTFYLPVICETLRRRPKGRWRKGKDAFIFPDPLPGSVAENFLLRRVLRDFVREWNLSAATVARIRRECMSISRSDRSKYCTINAGDGPEGAQSAADLVESELRQAEVSCRSLMLELEFPLSAQRRSMIAGLRRSGCRVLRGYDCAAQVADDILQQFLAYFDRRVALNPSSARSAHAAPPLAGHGLHYYGRLSPFVGEDYILAGQARRRGARAVIEPVPRIDSDPQAGKALFPMFRWLAMYQCGGMEPAEIAKETPFAPAPWWIWNQILEAMKWVAGDSSSSLLRPRRPRRVFFSACGRVDRSSQA